MWTSHVNILWVRLSYVNILHEHPMWAKGNAIPGRPHQWSHLEPRNVFASLDCHWWTGLKKQIVFVGIGELRPVRKGCGTMVTRPLPFFPWSSIYWSRAHLTCDHGVSSFSIVSVPPCRLSNERGKRTSWLASRMEWPKNPFWMTPRHERKRVCLWWKKILHQPRTHASDRHPEAGEHTCVASGC